MSFPEAEFRPDFLRDYMVPEPSAVDQLAAIEDPAGEAAERVAKHEEWLDRVRRLRNVLAREFVDVVTIEAL